MRLHSQEWVSFILRWVCFFEKNCEKQAFLYPEHLRMMGRYNSLFGYDEKILWDEKQLQDYLEQGIDRIVVNVSL